ncbi:MAG: RNA polymerase sigma factor [Floccifex sp.]
MDDFEHIYSDYFDVVFRYILSICKDEALAEEITQETFFKALKKIDSFRGNCKINVWLCQIAKNTYYTLAKKQTRYVDYPLEQIPSNESIEQKIIKKEQILQIYKIIHEMEQPYKEVFELRTFSNLSFKDISLLCGKTESWARVTYHRAKCKIKEALL